jgi:hypothetical protein
MAQKKSSKSTPKATSKKEAEDPRKAAKSVVDKPMDESENEHDEHCGCHAESEHLFEKNAERCYALRDLWFESLVQAVDEQIAPEMNKREMLFLTLSNSILDMMMDILPEDIAAVLAENLDDYLAVTLINKKYDVDLLKSFQEDFVAEKGENFETEEQLADALADFEDKFWNGSRKDLGGKSPNQAVEAALKYYDLL